MKHIHIGVLDTDNNEEVQVINAIKSGFLSAGPAIEEFENKVASLHGKKHGIFVNSGQSALEVALVLARECLGIHDRPLRVLVPTTTYAATLWAVLITGNVPVFCDIDPRTFCIDYTKVSEKYDIALPVDLCGHASSAPPEKNIMVVEDACEAVGNSKCIYGDIICISFYVAHIITTGCGGIVCLNDDYLTEYARSYIAHGRKFGGDFTKYKDVWVDRFLFDKVGVSVRGNALDAAFGLAQLKKLDRIIQKRQENARHFYDLWINSDIKDRIQLPSLDYISNCVFQFFPIVLDNGLNREKVLKFLFTKGIDSRVLLSLTNQPIFRKLYGNIEDNYPVSKFTNAQGFILGCHQQLNASDIEYVFETLKQVIKE
jgi:dTDP-4-amino-4,6-dideoxygalactose transaminase